MRKILIASLITASLLTASIAPALAEDVQSTQTGQNESAVVTTENQPAASTPTVSTETTSVTAPVIQNEEKLTVREMHTNLRNMIEQTLVKDIDPKIVEQLRAKDYGYAKIAIISALSQKTGKTVDEVVKIIEENKDADKIAQALGINTDAYKEVLKTVNAKIAEAEKAFKESIEKELVKNIDSAVVKALRSKGFGYGKIALVVKLSEKSGKTVDEVVKILEENKGIGATAKALGIKVGDYRVVNSAIEKSKSIIQNQKVKMHVEKLKKEIKKDKEELKKDYNKLKETLKKRNEKAKSKR